MQIRAETAVGFFILVAIIAFIYMSFQIGYFNSDRLNYASYVAYFDDACGLTKKSDVKISGIKVGWVDSIELSEDRSRVKANLMVSKKYILNKDAQAFIRQDSLLGFKFVDLIPGIQNNEKLEFNGVIEKKGRTQVSIDELLYACNAIAQNVKNISDSLKETISTSEGINQLKDAIKEFNNVSNNIVTAAQKIKEVVSCSEQNISTVFTDIKNLIQDVKEKVPDIVSNVQLTAHKIRNYHLPEITDNFSKVSQMIFHEGLHLKNEFLPEIKQNASKCTQSIEELSTSIKRTSDEVYKIAKKINDGNSFLGLLDRNNCTNSYSVLDFVDTMNCCFKKIRNFSYGFENYHEFLFNFNNNKKFNNYKTQLNFWLHPTNKCFLLGGLIFSNNGFVAQKKIDINQNLLNSSLFCSNYENKNILFTKRKFDSFAFNLQGGWYFNNLAMRMGFFESTPGVALDLLVPFKSDNVKWISSFEIFDFTGKNNLFNKNPHLKWSNRFYFSPYFYLSLGLDDFASKLNKNFLFGFGFNFGDTYFKSPLC